MEIITSRDNKNVKDFVKLSTSKTYRDDTNLFAIESVKLVLEAVNSDVEIKKVFVTQACLDKNNEALQKLFEKIQDVFLIDEIIEKKMTQINNSGGIFAICEKFHIGENLPKSGKFIFLCELQDSGNVGTILRTAKALSMDGVIFSKNMCDVYSQKVIRASMGAMFRLPMYFSGDMLSDLAELNSCFSTYATVLDEDAKIVQDINFGENCIVVIGNEGNGLTAEVANACTQKLTIPMKGEMESLNAGIAAGILIWELSK